MIAKEAAVEFLALLQTEAAKFDTLVSTENGD